MATVKGGGGTRQYLNRMSSKLKTAKEVQVGFPEGSLYPDGTPIATAAASANYGNPARGVPPRPFFSNAITKGRADWGNLLKVQLQLAKYDAAKALELTGMQMAGDIAQSLVETNGPPLSPVTLLLRQRFPDRVGMTFADVLQAREDVASGVVPTLSGSGAKPLIWTGLMFQHLQGPQAYEVKT